MQTNDHTTETENEENFAEMFAQAYKEPSRMEPGQKIEAPIVKLTPEWALIAVGGKGEGYVDINELKDAEGTLLVREGDKIRAYFLGSAEGEMRFTTKIGSGPAARAQIADAFRNHLPVEGVISREIKGGFEITIGGARAFCPFSQMGTRREETKADYVGKTMLFDIIECGERNVVLSRKAILEAERREKTAALRETLKEGDRIKGVVTSIQKFGAFVDIGGVEGLLPVSEIAWSRTERVGDLLSVGQPVEVLIKRLDWQNDKISFSLKDILPNPWDTADRNWPPGSYHTGKVSRLVPFGAFVTLGDGVDGLIHISRLGGERRIASPEEVLKVGQSVEVRIESVDTAARKISLIPGDLSRAEEENTATMDRYRGQADAAPQELGSMGEMLKKAMEKKGKV